MTVIVAIDGPAGAGKSTVAQRVSARSGLPLVDTGAIYRTVALLSLEQNVKHDDEDKLSELARDLPVRFAMKEGTNTVTLEGRDITEAIRTTEVSMRASKVSQHKKVRAGLLELQRSLGKTGAVLEGRDIGTVVFPDADVKIFLDADENIRAERRSKELAARGVETPMSDVLEDIKKRDKQDRERDVAPLKAADDATHLDSTAMHVDEVVNAIVALIDKAQAKSKA